MQSNAGLTAHVLAALLVVLVVTVAFGRAARVVGQPAVVGELVAGVTLGPSVLGALSGGAEDALFSPGVKSVIYVLGTVGLTLFMFMVGLDIDTELADRQAVRRSVGIAVSGLLPPFAIGAMVALAFRDQLAAPSTSRLQLVLFVGGALSITAFPVLARILQERDMTHTELGSRALMAAAVDDAVAWILLVAIVAMAKRQGALAVPLTIAGTAGFVVVALGAGRYLLRGVARRVQHDGGLGAGSMAAVLAFVLACGWFTDAIGIHAVFGGFVAGMAIPPSSRLREILKARLSDINVLLFVPAFFVYSGLNTRLGGLDHGTVLGPMLAIVAAAFVGKYVGCLLTARRQGLSWRHSSAIGGLMNARGLVILIFIDVGLAYGVITPTLFAILVVVAIVTTASTLPIYRLSFPPWREELERQAVGQPPPPYDPSTPVLFPEGPRS